MKRPAHKKSQKAKMKVQNVSLASNHNQQGIAFAQQGQFEAAVRCFQQALTLNPRDPETHNNLGIAFMCQGQLKLAIASYQKAIALNPNYAQAYYNLGNTLKEKGQLKPAADHYQRAIALNPNYAEMHLNLGNVYQEQQQFEQAIECYYNALALNPQYTLVHYNLGNALKEQGQLQEAITCYQQALTLDPTDANVYLGLGLAMTAQNKLVDAIEWFQRAISFKADFAEAHYNLGLAFEEREQFEQAADCFKKAIEFKKDYFESYDHLGLVLQKQNQLDKAIECFRQAITLKPNLAGAHFHLAEVLYKQNKYSEATTSYRRTISLQPNFYQAHYMLGLALKGQGQLDKAIAQMKVALEINPHYEIALSGLVMTLNYMDESTPDFLFAEHKKFDEIHALPLNPLQQNYLNPHDPQRPLKIGYVSGDFRRHSVGYFMFPILAHHDHQQFQIFCYYNDDIHDNFTQRFQSYADQWIESIKLSDEALAERIKQDQIDILVDLSGHTAGSRLLVFARKPAPIQVTYLGYPNTTGLTAIDYALTDNYVEPAGVGEQWRSEKPLRMPHSYFCYQASDDSPEVNELPALSNRFITFGSFNNYIKLTPKLLTLWAQILNAVPDSKLVVKAQGFSDPVVQKDFKAFLARFDIAPERLKLSPWSSSTEEHLKMYHQIDIGLDSYPYNGATTTCEALWMGVPIVSLKGEIHVSRMGFSLLSTVDLTELVADSPTEYVNICTWLANNITYLQQLRSTLRERMQTSPLMDGIAFTQQLETFYRQMWNQWLTQH